MLKRIMILLSLILLLNSVTVFALDNNKRLDFGEKLEDKDVGAQIITGIELVGNKLISDQEIISVMELEKGERLNKQQLKKDLAGIFDLGYFMNLDIVFSNYNGGVLLIIKLIENPIIKDVSFVNNSYLTQSQLKSKLELNYGEILNLKELNKGLEKIISAYDELGFTLARIVDIKLAEDNRLEIKLDEGKINKLIIQGNEVTDSQVIKRELSIKDGDILNIDQLWRDIMVLRDLGYFSDVIPRIDSPDNNPERTDLIIQVKEGGSKDFKLSGEYNSLTDLAGQLELTENNLFGKGQQIGIKLGVAEDLLQGEINFTDRGFLDSDIGLDKKISWDNGIPVRGVSEGDYGEEINGKIRLNRYILEQGEIYLELAGARTYHYASKDNFKEKEYQDQADILTTQIGGIRDNRNDYNNPNEGSKYRLDLKRGFKLGKESLDNDTFYQLETELETYYLITDRNKLAFNLRAGLGSSEMPKEAKYYLRDFSTLRGYTKEFRKEESEYFVGPSVLFANLSYHYRVMPNLDLMTYLSLGRTFSGFEFEFYNFNYTLGVESDFDLGLVDLNFAYGYAIKQENSEFSLKLSTAF